MLKSFSALVIFCLILLFHAAAFADVLLIDKYPQQEWLINAGANIYYQPNKEVLIKKFSETPEWAEVILEVDTIDLARDNILKFNVINLKGQYAVDIYFNKPGNAQELGDFVRIQEFTSALGAKEYNVSNALRMEGFDQEGVAIHFLVADPVNAPATAMVTLNNLSFGPSD